MFSHLPHLKFSQSDTKFAKIWKTFRQILTKHTRNCQRLLKFWKSGTFWPNLVTLARTKKASKKHKQSLHVKRRTNRRPRKSQHRRRSLRKKMRTAFGARRRRVGTDVATHRRSKMPTTQNWTSSTTISVLKPRPCRERRTTDESETEKTFLLKFYFVRQEWHNKSDQPQRLLRDIFKGNLHLRSVEMMDPNRRRTLLCITVRIIFALLNDWPENTHRS